MKHIYDNSNIAESYAGVTTPLTFSFARSVYEGVYQHFCRMMGVPERTIARHRDLFSSMVVFLAGRIYYDLVPWYRMVSFLPGYRSNRLFFESMLGVQQSASPVELDRHPTPLGRFLDRGKMAIQAIRIIWSFLRMGRLTEAFLRDFDQAYAAMRATKFETMPIDELEGWYQTCRQQLVERWRVPIANDFAVMVSVGIAGRLAQRWTGRSVGTLLTIGPEAPLISLDPGHRFRAIVDSIAANPAIFRLFRSRLSEAAVVHRLHDEFSDSATTLQYDEYLERFGGRVPSELKLESTSLNGDPSGLVALLRRRLSVRPSEPVPAAHQFDDALGAQPLFHQWILRLVLRWARRSLARREETRYRRVLVFGEVRRLFLDVGNRLAAQGMIHLNRDVFFLTVDQAFAAARGVLPKRDLARVVATAKRWCGRWQEVEPPRRIEDDRPIPEIEASLLGRRRRVVRPQMPLTGLTVAQGDGRSVQGEALVLSDFDPSCDFSDKILVTRQTDPGWTAIFPMLRGLVVERGGILSHAAVVARELGIPCIVGVEGAVASIVNGRSLQLNLDQGEVVYAD